MFLSFDDFLLEKSTNIDFKSLFAKRNKIESAIDSLQSKITKTKRSNYTKIESLKDDIQKYRKEWDAISSEMESDPDVQENPDNSPAVRQYARQMDKVDKKMEKARQKIDDLRDEKNIEKLYDEEDKLFDELDKVKAEIQKAFSKV